MRPTGPSAGLLGAATIVVALVAATPDTEGLSRDRRTRAVVGTGELVAATTMRANRAAHTATALIDGRVLVAGGFVEKGSVVGAEIYEPATASFSIVPPMVVTRHSHTATRLGDGSVLITGGYGEGTTTLASAELFDPRTRTFAPTGGLLEARADHVAVLLQDGTVLVAGGLGPGWTFLASAEVYDPQTRRFARTGPMTIERESHTAVRLDDGRVLMAGGHRGRRAALRLHASAEVYDPTTGAFTRVGDLRTARHKHDAVRLPDGRVLVTGGSDERDSEGVFQTTEVFDPRRGTFASGPSMHLPRYKHAGSAVVLADGRVLLAGGAAQAELHDPRTGTFTLVPGAPRLAGLFSAVAPLADGGALITGGYGQGRGPRASAWRYSNP
jgi:hypothetical protein